MYLRFMITFNMMHCNDYGEMGLDQQQRFAQACCEERMRRAKLKGRKKRELLFILCAALWLPCPHLTDVL